jgi:hypothetical protein
MNPNSIYVDRRLFPKVSELTILDASTIFDSRLKGAEDEHAIRLDIYSVAWDGKSVLGTDQSYMIGRRLPSHKGATRLRHALRQHVKAFNYIVCDPQEPNVVSLVGPSPVPQGYGEDFKLTLVEDLLASEKFATLTTPTKAVVALLKFVSTYDPSRIGTYLLGLGNGWTIESVTPFGEPATFFVREVSPVVSEEQNPEEVRDE